MNNKKNFEFIFGLILIFVGLFMIFKNSYVYGFSFYSIGRVNTGGILIVLLILSVIFAVIKPSKLSKALIFVILGCMVLSLILGMHIGFKHMSVLDIILMIVPLAVGAGLVIKTLMKKGE